MSLGTIIKTARENKKLTQKQLAQLIGAKHNSISNWENDQNKPDVDTLELICGVLEIDPNIIFKPTTKNQPQELPLTADEKELIKCYKLCSNEDKEELLMLAKHKALKNTIAAGESNLA